MLCRTLDVAAYAGPVTRLRWGDKAPTGVADARERLVVAADACISRFGTAKTTLDDVAAEANVSRATVYRYFGNREELVLAVMLRELQRSYDRSLHEFVDHVTGPADAAAAVADAAAYLLATIRGNPKLGSFLAPGPRSALTTVNGAAEAFFGAVADELRPYLDVARSRGVLRADVELDDIAEWIVRTILSLLTVPGPRERTPDEERALLAAFLVPALLPAP